jgi:hypothetical protein
MKKTALVIAGIAAALTLPAIASTQLSTNKTTTLLPNQVEFLKLVDIETGTNLSSLKNDPTTVLLVQAAGQACGNTELQRKAIIALGGTSADATYASQKFETVFCNSTY